MTQDKMGGGDRYCRQCRAPRPSQNTLVIAKDRKRGVSLSLSPSVLFVRSIGPSGCLPLILGNEAHMESLATERMSAIHKALHISCPIHVQFGLLKKIIQLPIRACSHRMCSFCTAILIAGLSKHALDGCFWPSYQGFQDECSVFKQPWSFWSIWTVPLGRQNYRRHSFI